MRWITPASVRSGFLRQTGQNPEKIVQHIMAQHPGTAKLPAVLPAVLYHGTRRWNAPLSFHGMIEGGEDFREYVPDFMYRFYDPGRYGEGLALSGDAALNVTLHMFRHIFDAGSQTVFGQAADMAVGIKDGRLFGEILRWAVICFFRARNEDAGELAELIRREAGRIGDERIREVAMTAAEQLQKRGEILGASGIILKLTRKRFGKISSALEQKLKKSDMDMLDRFGEVVSGSDMRWAQKAMSTLPV